MKTYPWNNDACIELAISRNERGEREWQSLTRTESESHLRKILLMMMLYWHDFIHITGQNVFVRRNEAMI